MSDAQGSMIPKPPKKYRATDLKVGQTYTFTVTSKVKPRGMGVQRITYTGIFLRLEEDPKTGNTLAAFKVAYLKIPGGVKGPPTPTGTRPVIDHWTVKCRISDIHPAEITTESMV